MEIKEKMFYTKEHEWVKIDSNTITVGITDFAQSELGDVVFIEVDALNETKEEGEVFGSIEAVKTVSDLFMPLSGEVIEVNEALNDQPELINSDPFGKGWIIKIKNAQGDKIDTSNLLTRDAYKALIN